MQEKPKVSISIQKPSKISYKSLKESTSNKLSNIRKRLSTISSLDSGIGWLDESDNEEFHNPTHNNNSQNTVDNSNNENLTNDTTNYENFKVESTSKQICDRENGSPAFVPLKPTDCVTSKFIEIIETTSVNDKLTENTVSRLKYSTSNSSRSKYSFVPYRLTQTHNRAKNTLITKFNTLNTYVPSNELSTNITQAQITSKSCTNSSGNRQIPSTNLLLDIPPQNNKSNNSHCPEIPEIPEIERGEQKSRNLVKSKEHKKNLFEKVKLNVKKFLTVKNNRKEKYEAKNRHGKTNLFEQ
ncbi:16817_t:CDS:2 [Dentiscutata erythropus]|uniref:16817_t:CDS:1 n=1 Tax=Dentiscutata erythropus TaxID=1348616 RepID=A0A9N9HL19_9GLOM|nr:16817_t:CDS:2 [Dentiscutata erythropus]